MNRFNGSVEQSDVFNTPFLIIDYNTGISHTAVRVKQ